MKLAENAQYNDFVSISGYTSDNKFGNINAAKIDQETRTVYDEKGAVFILSDEWPKMSDAEGIAFVKQMERTTKAIGTIVGPMFFDLNRIDLQSHSPNRILPSRYKRFAPFYEFMKMEYVILKAIYGA
jgi:hypothetical protein